MSVLRWLGPGRWRTSHAGLAVSVDDGLTWHKRRPIWWNPTGRNRFQIGCFTSEADWVYLFGTTNGRYGPAYLARVRPTEITSGPYTYFDGRDWVGSRRRARPVLSGNVGELSVMPHERYGWLAMHLDETRGDPAAAGPGSHRSVDRRRTGGRRRAVPGAVRRFHPSVDGRCRRPGDLLDDVALG